MTISRIPSVEGGIQPTLLTAKGDLISATAASTVARLAVGSDAQILVADSTAATGLKWATASSGFVFIKSATFSNVATGSITDCFNSTYSNYYVTLEDFGAATPADDLQMVFMTATPTDSSSHYGAFTQTTTGGTVSGTGFVSNAKISIASSTGYTTSNDYGSGFMSISQAGASGRPRLGGQYINNGDAYPTTFGAMVGVTGAYVSLKFSTSSSNITGKVTVYGLAKS